MDARDLRLDWLRGFVAVVEAGGFTAAAARLHISQPALHTQIKQLAAWAGPLYTFSGRALALTPRGREVLALARDVLADVDAFVARQTGPVTPVLSAGRALQLHLLAHALRGWRGPLALRTEDRAATVEAVLSGRAHLGLTVLLAADRRLDATPVLDVDQVAVVPKDDPLARRSKLRVRALAGRPLVVPPPPSAHRAALAAALGADLNAAVEVDGWELMTHYAALGLGLAVVNAYVPAPPGTVAVPITDLPSLRVQLIKRRRAPPLAEVAALEAHLIKHLAQRRLPHA
ncbi:MAG: LysR family transcriptional regulator [Myxococcales bacterium]|nr:LysR family transcriptional regulator [Myxococcales bacterium]